MKQEIKEIKAAMTRQGLTQTRIAAMMGVSQSSVSLLLCGHTPMSGSSLIRFADALCPGRKGGTRKGITKMIRRA